MLWEQGQLAMQLEQPDRAIACYLQSLELDPRLVRNHLSLAAAYLEKGDEAAACPHLGRYVEAHPESVLVRLHHAELLWKMHRHEEARAAFEGTVADAQDELAPGQLIHCHSRLVQIAETQANEYAEHLNRGIGLYLLARERAGLPSPDGELSVESLLCRAAGELTLARVERREESRPSWYLFKVWSQLAQRQPALRSLRDAAACAPFSYLTPAEQRGLELVHRDSALEGRHR
jgi:tetratricopeptide (TPR) repeat protein